MTKNESKQKLAIDILKNEFDELIEKKEIKVEVENNIFIFLIAVLLISIFVVFSLLKVSLVAQLMLFLLSGFPAVLIFIMLCNVYIFSIIDFKEMIHKSFIVDDYDQNILDIYKENKNRDCFDDCDGFAYNDYYKMVKYKNISKSSLDIIDNSILRESILEHFKNKIENGKDLTVDDVLEFLLD